jgi:hypothetical protein
MMPAEKKPVKMRFYENQKLAVGKNYPARRASGQQLSVAANRKKAVRIL